MKIILELIQEDGTPRAEYTDILQNVSARLVANSELDFLLRDYVFAVCEVTALPIPPKNRDDTIKDFAFDTVRATIHFTGGYRQTVDTPMNYYFNPSTVLIDGEEVAVVDDCEIVEADCPRHIVRVMGGRELEVIWDRTLRQWIPVTEIKNRVQSDQGSNAASNSKRFKKNGTAKQPRLQALAGGVR